MTQQRIDLGSKFLNASISERVMRVRGLAAKVGQVRFLDGARVVRDKRIDADYGVPVVHQALAQMRTDESR